MKISNLDLLAGSTNHLNLTKIKSLEGLTIKGTSNVIVTVDYGYSEENGAFFVTPKQLSTINDVVDVPLLDLTPVCYMVKAVLKSGDWIFGKCISATPFEYQIQLADGSIRYTNNAFIDLPMRMN